MMLVRDGPSAIDFAQANGQAKIEALERMVGRQALEIEFLKGALKNAPAFYRPTPRGQ